MTMRSKRSRTNLGTIDLTPSSDMSKDPKSNPARWEGLAMPYEDPTGELSEDEVWEKIRLAAKEDGYDFELIDESE